MKYETLYDDFISLFPDDKFALEGKAKSLCIDETDGVHVWFGMIVVPFVIELLNSNKVSKLHLAFNFFEKMALSNDSRIEEVLEFSVLEEILSAENKEINHLKKYMGEKTLEYCLNAEKYIL